MKKRTKKHRVMSVDELKNALDWVDPKAHANPVKKGVLGALVTAGYATVDRVGVLGRGRHYTLTPAGQAARA